MLESQSESNQIEREVTILNSQGLHARPIMQFVDTAAQFASEVKVASDETVVDGKSPMEMMLLAATQGTRLRLTVSGDDARQAADALVELIERKFDEE
ncbi:MAG: HPr family phosphocarrier protein [Phycisphaerae bacterium]|nr:HPr family phosphocarrier protein [Phycisphaerae bacterium]